MVNLKINSTNVSISIKFILSLLISYLILFKGDAGDLINYIGNFIVSGNMVAGSLMLLTILAIYPVILYNFTDNKYLQKFRNIFLYFDIILVCINVFIGVLINTRLLNMTFSESFAQYIVLSAGSSIVYITISILILLLIKNFFNRDNEESFDNTKINNNPILFSGQIKRKQYIITKVAFYVFLFIMLYFKQHYSNSMFDTYEVIYLTSTQAVFILSFYAASKRLRNIRWSQWFLVLWSIPIIGICIGIPLLLVKNKDV